MTGPHLRHPVSALVSFHYYPNPAVAAELAAGGLRLIGDSGAYSAASLGKPIDLGAFADWCAAVRDSTCWLASLDVIGDAEASWRNWLALRERGLEVIPTVHYGAPPEAVDRYVAEGCDLVGLGGMVPRKSEQDRLMRWTVGMMRYARTAHPQLRFHGWGVTHPRLLLSLPWWSVDSSGFGQSYRYARLTLFDPDSGRFRNAPLDGRGVYRLGPLLRRWYSTEPAAVERPGPHNRPLLVRIAGRSLQLLEDHLRARHHVPAPSYGVRAGAGGTNVHAVDGALGNLRPLTEGTQVHAVSTALVDYTTLATGTNVHAALRQVGGIGEFFMTGPHLHASLGAPDPSKTGPLTGPHVHAAMASRPSQEGRHLYREGADVPPYTDPGGAP